MSAALQRHSGRLAATVLGRAGRDMLRRSQALLEDDSGATAIEYALIAAGVAIAIITAVRGIGTKLNMTFSSVSTQLN